jgi:hypothetical protein
MANRHSIGIPLPLEQRQRLGREIAARGERRVAAALAPASRTAITRALAGLGIRPGSAALIERGFAKLDAEDARLADAKQIAGGRP